MPLVDGGAADGEEELLCQHARNRAEGEGRVGRAEGGDADLGDRLAGCFREDAEAVEVGRLALVGGHAEGGVALGVLHRLVTLALGEFEIGRRHVVLEVDEVLVAFIVLSRGRREPDGFERALVCLHGGGNGVDVAGACELRARGVSLFQNLREAEAAVCGAHCGDLVVVAVRPEGLDLLVEADLAAIVAPEVQRRIPAAGHGDEITGVLRLLDHAALALAVGGELDVCDVEAAPAGVDGGDDGAGIDRDAHLARLVGQRPFGPPARVDNADADAGGFQHEGGLIGIVIVGEDDAGCAGGDTITLHKPARGRGQHDARAVIVGECNRALDGAGGEDHLMCAHLPQPVARDASCEQGGIVIGQPLKQHEEVVVEVAHHRRAVQHMDVFGGGELGRCGSAPLVKRVAVDGAAGDVGDAAEARVLIREDHLGAIGGCGFGCGKTGDAGADHQHVAMDVDLLIGVRVAAFGGFAQASGAADDGFVDVLPEGGGPHQRLVIEAAGDEA